MSANRWSIPLQKIADGQKERMHTIVRKVTLEAWSRVISRSPVDTGRFRANWNASVGAPNYATTPSVEQERGMTEAQKALTLPVGGITFLSNGLPYAQALEYGHSKQAPGGMVRLTILEINAQLAQLK
jgi:hypothetical protein